MLKRVFALLAVLVSLGGTLWGQDDWRYQQDRYNQARNLQRQNESSRRSFSGSNYNPPNYNPSSNSGSPRTAPVVPEGVTVIGHHAFCEKYLTKITIPNSVRVIEAYAFDRNPLTGITIGAGVKLEYFCFPYGFDAFYNNSGKKAGTYTRSEGSSVWTKQQERSTG